jgi:hypothetical protein
MAETEEIILTGKIWRRQEKVKNQIILKTNTEQNIGMVIIWRIEIKIILHTKYGGDIRVLLNR